MTPYKIVFAGTSSFAVPALDTLAAARQEILAVYTQPDRPAGRGQQLTMSPVKTRALEHGLHVEQPQTLRDSSTIARLANWRADLMVVAAYGLILPQDVLSLPRLGCLNIHGSLLPRWRGAAPIQRAILAGDRESGVAIMQMEAGLDTGPVLLEQRTEITPRETAGSLHERLAHMGAQLLLQTLADLAEKKIQPRPQPNVGVTYAAKIRKEEAIIDWSRAALEIDRQIRAFNPWPVAETRLHDQQLRIWAADPTDVATTADPGTVISADERGVVVATGDGALCLTRLQLAGRKPLSAAEFVRGQDVTGIVLGAR